jgi:hypothetical protein
MMLQRPSPSRSIVCQSIQPDRLSLQPDDEGDANRHVQPVPPSIAERDLKEDDHEQAHTGAGYPSGYAASPPQPDGGDRLDECAKLQGYRDDRVGGQRARISRHEEPCRQGLQRDKSQVDRHEPSNQPDTLPGESLVPVVASVVIRTSCYLWLVSVVRGMTEQEAGT